jgi:hypothetical protein
MFDEVNWKIGGLSFVITYIHADHKTMVLMTGNAERVGFPPHNSRLHSCNDKLSLNPARVWGRNKLVYHFAGEEGAEDKISLERAQHTHTHIHL